MIPTIITSSKGRLDHLKQSLATWLALTPCKIIVVDYGCPDHTHDWILREANSPRVEAIELRPHEHTFNKARALNAGARLSMTSMLLFLDADTRVEGSFWPWLKERRAPGRMFIVEATPGSADLTGVLCIARNDFESVGGYDESMLGWGSEDLDLRLRIFVERRAELVFMPPHLFEPIPHDDTLRTRFYDEKDKYASHQRNLQRLVNKLEAKTGVGVADHLKDPDIQSLFKCARAPSGA